MLLLAYAICQPCHIMILLRHFDAACRLMPLRRWNETLHGIEGHHNMFTEIHAISLDYFRHASCAMPRFAPPPYAACFFFASAMRLLFTLELRLLFRYAYAIFAIAAMLRHLRLMLPACHGALTLRYAIDARARSAACCCAAIADAFVYADDAASVAMPRISINGNTEQRGTYPPHNGTIINATVDRDTKQQHASQHQNGLRYHTLFFFLHTMPTARCSDATLRGSMLMPLMLI